MTNFPRDGPPPGPSSPFTATNDINNSNSLASMFETFSSDMTLPTPTDEPGTGMPAPIASIVESKASADRSSKEASTLTTVPTPSVTGLSSVSGTASSIGQSSNAANSAITASSTGTNSRQSATGTSATSAAANSANADLQEQSTMSKPGIQAAIAVPIVVFALVVIALIFFCMRRRKKRRSAVDEIAEKQPPAGAKNKKWTRHFRVFSFDNELLMGGRYSSTNSIRSRETGSLRSATRSQATPTPSARSIHSVESEVAPPYRDAVHNNQPSISQVMTGAVGGLAVAGVNRSTSNATAPPPYVNGARATPNASRQQSQRGGRNPFADSPPISPIEDMTSPFNDPPEATPTLSRNSSLFHATRDDASSIAGVSDAASIREATLARNASVRDGGRVIQNVRTDSQ